MRKKLGQKIGLAIWLSGFSIAQFAFAQNQQNPPTLGGGSVNTTVNLTNPIGATSFTQVVANITTFLITDIAIPLTAILVLVGGFQMITSAGNPEKFASGRKTLTYAAIGFVVVLLASSVVAIIQSLFKNS